MMIDPNKRRAKRVATVLTATGYRNGVEWDSALSDILKDLRHLADSKRLDFDAISEYSEGAYDQEVAEDSLPGQPVPLSYSHDSDVEYEYEEVSISEIEDEGGYFYASQQAKPLAEQTLHDFDAFFRECEGLTYVFLGHGPEQVNTVSPDVVSAVVLTQSALQGSSYDPPHADSNALEAIGRNAAPHDQVVQAVTARIMEMQRRKTEYLFIWHVAGDKGVRIAGDLGRYQDDLADFLKTEVHDYLFG